MRRNELPLTPTPQTDNDGRITTKFCEKFPSLAANGIAGDEEMNPNETDNPNSIAPVRSRWPHIVGVCAGIALLAGIVLLWKGSMPERASSESSALGSTISVGGTDKSPHVPLPVVLPAAASSSDSSQSPSGRHGVAESVDNSPPTTVSAAGETGTTQAEFKRAILGSWKQYSHGHRLLKVLEDGTATIDVKLDGLTALVLGEKLHFDIKWSIEDDTLVFKTIGGTPEASINTVKSLYGDNRVYRILEINEKQMLLQEGDEKKTPWDRVTEEKSPAAGPPQEAASDR